MTLQVVVASGTSKSAKADGGFLGISAKSSTGSDVASTSNAFKFTADFTGASTLQTSSAPSDSRVSIKSRSEEPLHPRMSVRSTMNLMFCPKPLASCTDADWVAETCTSPDCKITGATVEYSTKKFGTYVLHGSGSYVVEGKTDVPKSSAGSTLSVALSIAVVALVHLCI